MPDLKKFFHGFDIFEGLKIDGYKLKNMKGKHEVVKRYHKYKYPIRLVFSPLSGDSHPDDLITIFRDYVRDDKIIDSSYGNPYLCHFGTPKITGHLGKDIIITTMGTSKRIYENKESKTDTD